VDGSNKVFRPSKKGLFFSDVRNDIAHVSVNTVVKNKSKYTIKEYSDVLCMHSLQDIIGHPSTLDFIKYVEKHDPQWPNYKADIIWAEDILNL